jgi:FkbM family methyltransferase
VASLSVEKRDARMTKSLIDYLADSGFEADASGQVVLPDWVERVKIDVGLSYSAANSVQWIRQDPNLIVFGFEPLPESCIRLRDWLLEQADSNSLIKQLVILPVALGRVSGTAQLHIAADDTASSSLLTPKHIVQSGTVRVQVFPIVDLLRAISHEKVRRVDYLKLDCQGMDLEILKSAGEELRRIALVTAEAEDEQYLNSSNSLRELVGFMKTNGFIHLNPRSEFRVAVGRLLSRISFIKELKIRLPVRPSHEVASSTLSVSVEDPTFVNRAFLDEVMSGRITGFQKG